jgi:hypothetical protein
VRASGTSPAAGRDAIREKQRRGRLVAAKLRVRYPALSSLQIDFEFSDCSDFIPSPQVTVLHPPAPAYFHFSCPYSDCDGEFDLTRPVDLAVNSRDRQSSGQLRCSGSRHGGMVCTLCLEFTIAPHRL